MLKISACAQHANTQVAMLREEMEAMRQDTERQQQAMKDACDSKMQSLEEQHQALAEQAASIFQSFEYQGADELLSNILGPAWQDKASASASASVSPDSIVVSPDRWSCASTEEGQCRRTSPLEHPIASHTHTVKHAAHTKAQTKGDASGSSGRVLTSASSYSSSLPSRLGAVVTRTGAVASVHQLPCDDARRTF